MNFGLINNYSIFYSELTKTISSK